MDETKIAAQAMQTIGVFENSSVRGFYVGPLLFTPVPGTLKACGRVLRFVDSAGSRLPGTPAAWTVIELSSVTGFVVDEDAMREAGLLPQTRPEGET